MSDSLSSSSSSSVPRRFGGIARLYGESAFLRFRQAHVCVVGVGGVGSWAVEALARSGIGELTLIDLDNIAESNVNRQLHALTSLFGKPKAEALKERVAEINPHCRVNCVEDFVDTSNINTFFRQPVDFVIDAIDQVQVKAAMAAYFIANKQAFITSGSAGGQKDITQIRSADLSRVTHDPLLANMRYALRKHHNFSRDTTQKMHVPCVYSTENITPPNTTACNTHEAPQGLSCAGYGAVMIITAAFGLHCAQHCLDYLCLQTAR
ncbi:tRNA threonylcarbamoyladenosine dehydratase [Stenoxybacter acetivorans]|uniref:tRNA threonylcarbamoyladenosine dehydratase n=1 Tax=Stenoxybacter acetivorans TaxID=422441 RepID=UPI00056159EB|nr:tRNA threonylcarbamoyladenosine dehydratase [Stenoxybacter acetivorans]